MRLACIVWRGTDGRTHSFRSNSSSSWDNDGAAMVSRLRVEETSKSSPTANASKANPPGVTPKSNITSADDATPRLVRCRAVRRDVVRDWNFDQNALQQRQQAM